MSHKYITDQLNNVQGFFREKADHEHILEKKQEVVQFSQLDHSPHKFQNFNQSNFKDHSKSKQRLFFTKTKWDSFAPYSFSKLTNQHKLQAFLQLFDDYHASKLKLNQQIEKNKKQNHKIVTLEEENKKLRDKSEIKPSQRIKIQKEQHNQNTQLKEEVKRLHQKIVALTGSKNIIRPQSSHKKNVNKTQKIIVPVNENLRSQLQLQRKQIKQLLLIIDQLKRNKFIVEQQLKNKQIQDSKIYTNKKHITKTSNIPNQSQYQDFMVQLREWKDKYQDLEIVYRKMNEDKDKKIRQLTNQLIQIRQGQRMKKRIEGMEIGGKGVNQVSYLEDQNIRLKEDKQKLEADIRRLTQMPFYQNNKQGIELQQKYSDLELLFKRMKQQNSKTKDLSMKYFSQLQYKTKQNALLKSDNEKVKNQLKQYFQKDQKKPTEGPNIDYNDFYRKLLGLVKLQGDDPVWKKFNNVAAPSFNLMGEEELRKLGNDLWRSKLELLAHLEKAQVELKTIKDHYDSRIKLSTRQIQTLEEELRITKARLDQWASMERVNHRQYQVYQQCGIKYDDSVSVFQADETQIKTLQGSQNYFDLYLGHLVLDGASLIKNPQNKIKNLTQLVSLITIDFYNHQTQHTEPSQGITKKIAQNYSFKVEVNPYFIKYLSKNSIILEIWSPQGTGTIMLGKGQIRLRDLIANSTKEISPISRGKCFLYYQDRSIGTIEYRIRMRLSLSPFLQWIQNKSDIVIEDTLDPFLIGTKKRLSITVERGVNFKANSSVFVYFSIQNQDYYSEPQKGPTPVWDFNQQIDIMFNQQFLDSVKQNYIQFTIFDDQKQVNDDFYGIAKASFTPLIDTADSLDLKLQVRNGRAEQVGKIFIKAAWI